MSILLHLVWALINAAAYIGVFYLFIRYTSLINKRIGVFPALIFVLGITTMLSSITPNKNTNDNITINEADTTGFSQKHQYITMVNNKLVRVIISIQYQHDRSKTVTKILSAYTTQSGLVFGTKWKSNGINISKKDNNKFTYHVRGSYIWSILGIPIYVQSKYFKHDFSLQ